LANFGSFGSDEEHLSFKVAACARPMIAGDTASQDAAAADDFMNTRRLTGAIVMALSPRHLYCCAAIAVAAVCWRTV
jgi:hypothetical protein